MDMSICFACFNRSRMTYMATLPGGEQVERPLEPFPHTMDCLRKSVLESGLKVEIIVADFHSTDWPLAEWLPARADPIPVRIQQQDGPFSLGGGKNEAAKLAQAPILFFMETDMEVPATVLRRGMELATAGKGYFPRYQREHGPGAAMYWGAGHGCCIVRKDQWAINLWVVSYKWGVANEDGRFAHWWHVRELRVREDDPAFIHRWHPLCESKKEAEVLAAEKKGKP